MLIPSLLHRSMPLSNLKIKVKVGKNGIKVQDGDTRVNIGENGIIVTDGDVGFYAARISSECANTDFYFAWIGSFDPEVQFSGCGIARQIG